MKRLLAAGGAVLAAAAMMWLISAGDAIETIGYRGERVKLSKRYSDYDDYKNDPGNIDPSETTRVQALVTGAPIGRAFGDRQQAVRAVSAIVFPGYGASSWRIQPQPDGSSLTGLAIEVPRAGQDRNFVFRDRGGAQTLVDDFLAPTDLAITAVTEQEGAFVFSNTKGEKVLTRPVRTVGPF